LDLSWLFPQRSREARQRWAAGHNRFAVEAERSKSGFAQLSKAAFEFDL
jgi:hypothetical protein